jgi:hypothetical protein
MSTTIAHELNQPLSAIESYAFGCENLLQQQPMPVPQVGEALREIRQQAQRSADIVRTLRASGTFDFVFRHDRSPQLPGGHANSLGIRLTQCSMAYAGFPYPLSNVSGSIRMDRGHWTIRDITGSNDTGIVRCSGMLVPSGDNDGELTLNLDGTGVVLERELRDALPAGVRQVWDDVDPRGNAEFSATVRHHVKARRTEVEIEATPQGDTVSIEPAWFPYRLERLRVHQGCRRHHRPAHQHLRCDPRPRRPRAPRRGRPDRLPSSPLSLGFALLSFTSRRAPRSEARGGSIGTDFPAPARASGRHRNERLLSRTRGQVVDGRDF